MQRLSLAALLVSAALAACSGSSSDDADEVAEGALSSFQLTCTAGSTTIVVVPGSTSSSLDASLTDGTVQSSFVCTRPPLGSDASLVAVCKEGPQTSHEGQWEIDLARVASGYQTVLKKGDTDAPITASCTLSTPGQDAGTVGSSDGGTTDGSSTDQPVPTYAEVAPLIQRNCGGCHGQAFSTLQRISANRANMDRMISTGRMPKNNPSWRGTTDGKTVLEFLEHSTELQ